MKSKDLTLLNESRAFWAYWLGQTLESMEEAEPGRSCPRRTGPPGGRRVWAPGSLTRLVSPMAWRSGISSSDHCFGEIHPAMAGKMIWRE